MGAEQHSILFQVLHSDPFLKVNSVHRRVGQLSPHKQLHLAGTGQLAVPGIQVGIEHVVIVFHQAHRRQVIGPCQFLNGFHAGVKFLQLRQFPVGEIVIVQQAVPIDLRPKGCGAPPEEADIIRPMSDALHGPQHHLAGLGGRRVGTDAAARSRLLLHDSEMGAHRPDFHQAPAPLPVQQGVVVPGILTHGKGKVGIAVIGVHVQAILGHAVVVQGAEQTVGSDEITGLHILPEDVALHFAETDGTLRHEPHVIQLLVRISAVSISGAGHVDLLPCGVGLVPEGIAPSTIQLVQGAVLFPKELPECQGITFGVELLGLAVELIVDLPAHDAGPLPVMLPQLLHHPGGKLLVFWGIVVIVAAHAVTVQHSVPAGVEHLRVFVGQPSGGRGCGGAENNLHTHALRQIQEFIPEIVGEHPLFRFGKAPGKFSDANGGDAVIQHPAQILLPQGFIPVLRVIARPQLQFLPGGSPFIFHNRFLPKGASERPRSLPLS
ncbi:unknown [Clostridium sp. CAG:1013]|nr:unknown [Clostridium sp. CAG:1013]